MIRRIFSLPIINYIGRMMGKAVARLVVPDSNLDIRETGFVDFFCRRTLMYKYINK